MSFGPEEPFFPFRTVESITVVLSSFAPRKHRHFRGAKGDDVPGRGATCQVIQGNNFAFSESVRVPPCSLISNISTSSIVSVRSML